MKHHLGPIIVIFILSFAGLSQEPPLKKENAKPEATSTATQKTPSRQTSTVKTKSKTASQLSATARTGKPKPKLPGTKQLNEKEEFEKASATEDLSEKIVALNQFLVKFPASARKNQVLELIAVSRIHLGQSKLKASETEEGVALLKSAVIDLPVPIPDELFNGTIVKIPTELYWNGLRAEALEIAGSIEGKIGGNPVQLLSLAGFYLGIENGSDAKRLAEKAIAIDPKAAAGYQTLGLSARLNFDLDEAEKAYTNALELEPDSQQSLRSLAEIKRGSGKADEAVDLYRRILEKDAVSIPAETGLILSLFDAGKRGDAEAELARSLEQNPNNVILLAGTAYWYAAHNEPDKAIEYSRSAIEKEPRYIWSHIALARGLLAKNQPAAAEEVLLKARQFGNFPTLEYELASARFVSGFFHDAADELKKSFVVKDGVIHTRLGGRVDRSESGFVELLANERRASTFEPVAADNTETAAGLKALLEFDQVLNESEPNEEAAGKAADIFVKGDDRMRLHRELYAASSLLGKRIALPKVLELTKSAIGNTEEALEVPDPGAAVMASELYDRRAIALARSELIKVPEVPKSTLSAILRGRIEEIAGWALFYQNDPAGATVRLRRAVSVMPAKSSWWRSSMWKLGAALQADGKDADALDAYVKSYSIDKPDAAKYATVAALYRKVNGNTDGLEKKIGADPQPIAVQQQSVDASTAVAQKTEPVEPGPVTSPTPLAAASTKPEQSEISNVQPPIAQRVESPAEASPTPVPSPATIDGTPAPATAPTPTAETSPAQDTQTTPTPEPSTPVAVTTPMPAVQVLPTPTPVALATPTPEAQALPTPTPVALAAPTPDIQPTPTPAPDIQVTPTPTPEVQALPTPTPVALPTPTPDIQLTSTSTADSQVSPSPTPDVQTTPTPEMATAQITPSVTPDLATVAEVKRSPEPAREDSTSNRSQTSKPHDLKATGVPVTTSENGSKPLFEPVIITVPKPQAKRGLTNLRAKSPDVSSTDTKPNVDDEVPTNGEARPRVIAGKDVNVVEPPACAISVSRETISILNNGGGLGILLQMDAAGDLKSVSATPDSPDDIKIELEPEIAGIKGQAFYLIRSVTTRKGEFKVRFAAPCGSKEITVVVR